MQSSYNHPAGIQPWRHHRPPHHAGSLNVPPSQLPPTHRPRFSSISGSSEPTIGIPQASIPPSLTAGPHRARIWDKNAAQHPHTAGGNPMPFLPSPHSSPQRLSLYGDYFFSQPQLPLQPPPPLPRKPQALLSPPSSSLPPVPPKPAALVAGPSSRNPLYPTSISLPVFTPSSNLPESIAPEPLTSSPDEKGISRALTVSASDAQLHEQALIDREEEDLARALEESRLTSATLYSIDEQSSSPAISARPLSVDGASTCGIKSPTRRPEGESWLHLMTPSTSGSSSHFSIDEDLSPLHPSPIQNEFDGDLSESSQSTPIDVHTTRSTSSPLPPLYATIVPSPARNPLLSPSAAAPSSSSATPSTYLPSDRPSAPDRTPSSPSLSTTQSSNSDHTPMSSPFFGSRPSWSSVSSETSTSAGRSLGNELVSGYKSPIKQPASPNLSLASSANLESLDKEAESRADAEAGPSARLAVSLSANQYVEREMLLGVSMGFSPPVISTELIPMAGAMPNVITLPYGKAPVFHFQAPSWRKLLKLMARLSGTRVEPTVEALGFAKHALKLRTVIQFVKIHHSSSEWRTVLYLTTDYPVPPNVPNAYRYTNGDVSALPYSYALSPLAPLLRDGPESPMAKYYVVPSTTTTPYPTLPIDFPDLAMYLQSAVRDSRRAVGDSSGGIRKLAQYIDNCYQIEAEVTATDREAISKRGGVAFMFKRVMGRNKASKSGGGNDEIYDLVTPFVPDEWG